MKAGIPIPGFTHILSFRRQLYIKPEDMENLPETIQIDFEGTTYWIYVSSDAPVCFICKEQGHMAKQCQAGNSMYTNLITTHTIDEPPVISNDNVFPTLPEVYNSTSKNRDQTTTAQIEKQIELSNSTSKQTAQQNYIVKESNPPKLTFETSFPIDTTNKFKFKRPISSSQSTDNISQIELNACSDSSIKHDESTDDDSLLNDYP